MLSGNLSFEKAVQWWRKEMFKPVGAGKIFLTFKNMEKETFEDL